MSKMTERKGKREQRETTGESWKPQSERRMEERQEQERKKGHKKTSQGKENVDALRIVQFDETSRPFTDPDQIEEPRSLFCSVCSSMIQCPDVEIYLQYIGMVLYNRHPPHPCPTSTVGPLFPKTENLSKCFEPQK